jgi:hypothetical protein
MIFEYLIQMSSQSPSLKFRDSIETVAGESTRILSDDNKRSNDSNKIVTFSNDPIVYYYDPEIPSYNRSQKNNYSEINHHEIPIVYLPTNNPKKCKCMDMKRISHIKIYMTYLLPMIVLFIFILILLFILFIY